MEKFITPLCCMRVSGYRPSTDTRGMDTQYRGEHCLHLIFSIWEKKEKLGNDTKLTDLSSAR